MLKQWHISEVHAENACYQVEWQKNRRQHGKHAHEVVGAGTLGAEVDLYGCFSGLLQALGMGAHAVDVLKHIAGAGGDVVASQAGMDGIGMERFQWLLKQPVKPFLQRIVLLVAQVFKQVQLAAREHKRVPVMKRGAGFEQICLPFFKLGAEVFANGKVAIYHAVNHAQAQVCWCHGQARADVARVAA